MQMLNSKTALFLLMSLTLVTGCNYRVEKTGPGQSTGGEKVTDVPDFQTVFDQVIDKRCTECHGGGSSRSDLSSYEAAKGRLAEIRDLVTRPSSDPRRMPKNGKLTEGELNLLLAWIDAGGPRTVERPVATPEPTATPIAEPTPVPTATPVPEPIDIPDFKTVYKTVFDGKCMECHNGFDQDDLGTYEAVKPRLAKIQDRVTRPEGAKGRMPPKSREQLTEKEKQLLLTWIAAGGPETVSGQPTPTPTATPLPTATPVPTATPGPTATPLPTATPAAIEPTYASINQHIFQPRCIRCHSEGNDGQIGFDLENLTGIVFSDKAAIEAKDASMSKLIKAVTRNDKNRMPPPPRPELKPEEIEVLKRWIGLGAPQ